MKEVMRWWALFEYRGEQMEKYTDIDSGEDISDETCRFIEYMEICGFKFIKSLRYEKVMCIGKHWNRKTQSYE